MQKIKEIEDESKHTLPFCQSLATFLLRVGISFAIVHGCVHVPQHEMCTRLHYYKLLAATAVARTQKNKATSGHLGMLKVCPGSVLDATGGWETHHAPLPQAAGRSAHTLPGWGRAFAHVSQHRCRCLRPRNRLLTLCLAAGETGKAAPRAAGAKLWKWRRRWEGRRYDKQLLQPRIRSL